MSVPLTTLIGRERKRGQGRRPLASGGRSPVDRHRTRWDRQDPAGAGGRTRDRRLVRRRGRLRTAPVGPGLRPRHRDDCPISRPLRRRGRSRGTPRGAHRGSSPAARPRQLRAGRRRGAVTCSGDRSEPRPEGCGNEPNAPPSERRGRAAPRAAHARRRGQLVPGAGPRGATALRAGRDRDRGDRDDLRPARLPPTRR